MIMEVVHHEEKEKIEQEVDPNLTVFSIDSIGTFDLISCVSMLTALMDARGCDKAFPFVRQFHGRPSIFL